MRSILLAVFLVSAALSVRGEVTLLPGSSPQSALIRDPVANPVRVLVTDKGVPKAGVRVELGMSYPGRLLPVAGAECYPGFCRTVTGADGVAEFKGVSSASAGTIEAWISAGNWQNMDEYFGHVEATLTFLPRGLPMKVAFVEGMESHVVFGTASHKPIRVRVLTSDNQPVGGQKLTFGPAGSVDYFGFDYRVTEVTTDPFGVATLPPLYGGWGLGRNELTATTFDAEAGADISATTFATVENELGQQEVALTNMWWGGMEQNGWGVSVVKHGGVLFNVYFVYDNAGLPTWYAQPGGFWRNGIGATFQGWVYSPRSAPWFAYDKSKFVPGEAIGSVGLDFKGPTSAMLGGGIEASGFVPKPLRPQDFRGGALERGVSDMWWGGPEQDGWGMAIVEQEGNIFMVWYTYGADGKPTWFVMPSGSWSAEATWSGKIYTTRSSAWLDNNYDASKLVVTEAGSYVLRFQGNHAASFQYMLEGRTGTLNLVRQPF